MDYSLRREVQNKMWNDEIGRYFCAPHRREICNECCYDFDMINRQIEIDNGMRKAPSEIEKLAEMHVMLVNGIKFMKDNKMNPKEPNFVMHTTELNKVEAKITAIRAQGKGEEFEAALNAARRKSDDTQADVKAVSSAWAKENPGKSSMEYGGAETQRLYEQVAALPPSASIDRADKFTCSYCNKSSTEKLLVCSQCRSVAYCNRECQKLAWKGHKKVCHPKETTGDEKKTKLPLTWEQLEAFGGFPAEGKTLEVRVMNMVTFPRQVLDCKDRVGAVRRIAAYTDSRTLPGAATGRVLRWKNPHFHYFMDGSSGARLEDQNMVDVTISDN